MKRVSILCLSLFMAILIAGCGGEKKITVEDMCKNLSSVQAEEAKLSDFTKIDENDKTYHFAEILSSTNTNRGRLTVTEKGGNFEGLMINISSPNPEYVSGIAIQATEDIGISKKSRKLIKEKMLSLSDENVTHLLDSDGYRISSCTTASDSKAGFLLFIASGKDFQDYKEGNYQEIKS